MIRFMERRVTFFSNGVTYRGYMRPDLDSKYRRGVVMYAHTAEEEIITPSAYPLIAAAMKWYGVDHPYTRRGEFPNIDKAFDRMNREIVTHKRRVLVAFLTQLGLDPAAFDLKFSRKAGCRCGCSPGFIAAPKDGSWLGRWFVWMEPAPLALPPGADDGQTASTLTSFGG